MREALHEDSRFSVSYDNPRHQGMMLEGLNSLREKGKLIDVNLIVEGHTFQAHKAVLAACSDYFCAMFTDNMLESRSKEIRLNGISSKGFHLVLEYAYTSKISLNLDNVQDVLEAASHVQMLALVQTCSNYLETEINIDNCLDIATIAETYSLSVLKLEVYRFMSENLMAFSCTSEFQRLTPQQFETLLSYDFPVDCSEFNVLRVVLVWLYHINKSGIRFELNDAIKIMRFIHFKEISRRKLRAIIHSIFKGHKYEWELYKVIISELYRDLCFEKFNINPSLINSRGMDLAILKIGGFGIGGITNEITYSFASNPKWKHLTSIPHVEQCNFGTCVLNNELYIVGGCFNQSLQENIHPFGFRYSPLQNKWSTMAPMNLERCRFSLNVVGSFLYAVGGTSELTQYDKSTCEFYDPYADKWYMLDFLPGYVTQHAGATYENGTCSKLFISGGMDRDSVQNSMYSYDVDECKWLACAPMLTPRVDHVMLTVDSRLYVCGGWQEDPETNSRILVDTIDCYDVETNTWQVVTHIPTPRYHAGIVEVNRKIYFIGGFHSDAMFDKDTAAIECYDMDKNSWTTEEKYPQDVWEHTCATLYVPKCRDDMEVICSSVQNV